MAAIWDRESLSDSLIERRVRVTGRREGEGSVRARARVDLGYTASIALDYQFRHTKCIVIIQARLVIAY